MFEVPFVQQEEICHALVSFSRESMMVIDSKGNIEFANPSALKLIGSEPDEHVPLNLLTFVHPDDQQSIRDVFARTSAKPESPLRVRFRVGREDGGWIPVESVARGLERSANGRIVMHTREAGEFEHLEARLQQTQKVIL